MNYLIGVLQVLASGICFGFLGIFARFSLQQGLSVGEILSLRFSLAALFLWMLLLVFRRKLIRLNLRQILVSSALGIFGYAVFSTFYFKAIEGIAVPLAAMLLFTFPFFVNLGAHFILKERMTRFQAFCLSTASLGLVLLLWGDFSIQKTNAIFWGLGSGLTYAIYVLVSGKLQRNVQPLSSSLYVMTAAALALIVYHQPNLEHLASLSLTGWNLIFSVALLSTILPITLFLAGLQKMKSSKASVIVMVEPVTATLAASYFLHENLTWLQLSGGLLILLAVILDAVLRPEITA